jgi:arylsulfatase A-like enzyme
VEDVEYVPEKLSNAGIRTLATGRSMGRWHRRGFSEYYRTDFEAKKANLSRSLKHIHPMVDTVVSKVYNGVTDAVLDTSQEGRSAIEELLDRIEDGPFYGFVHLMDTHNWYEANPELVDHLLAENDYPDADLADFFEEYSQSPVFSNILEPNAEAADNEVGLARLFARYDAAVRKTDNKIGNLVRGLKEQGFWDDTVLFVLSDHGESLNEHGIYFDHHGLYDQTTKVPLIAHIPGLVSTTVDEFVQIHELAPTILDLLDVPPIEDAHGRNLVGYLDDDREEPPLRDAVFIEEAHTQRRRAIRTDRFKYIEHVSDEVVANAWGSDSFTCGYCDMEHGDKVELYDLHDDPREMINLAEDRPEIVNEMVDKVAEYTDTYDPSTVERTNVNYEDEEEVLARLEDLGYR